MKPIAQTHSNSFRVVQTTATFLALFYMPILAYSQTWDAAANFSFSSNPNGAWSYGYTSTSGTGFVLLHANVQNPYGWNNGGNTYSPDIGYPSGEFLGLHPYQGTGPAACLRWTAPNSGNYNISTTFVAPASSTGFNMGQTIYILTNGVVAYENSLVSYSQSFSTTATFFGLQGGATIDVVVADNAGVANNWTSVSDIIYLETPHAATATANVVNGFVVGVTLIDDGYGYTNAPLVRFIGGGGSGAQAAAMVSSNGQVTNVSISNPGSGYTNTPIVVIAPPYILNPILSIAPMTFVAFSNLTVGGVYQFQQWEGYYWSNQPVSFTATNAVDTQIVAGLASSREYQMALTPVPAQAFATAQVVNGFIVAYTVTSGGSGYVTAPAVTIVGSGSNATAVASISSGGVVTNIAVGNPGIGYTNAVTVEIAQPPTTAVSPTMVLPMVQLNSTNLAPYDNYQFQFTPTLNATWANWTGGLFVPTTVTNSQLFFFTNYNTGFFRLQYLP